MSEENTLLILKPNTLELQKFLRNKELELRGIPEPERSRAVEAEFVDYPTSTDIEPWPGPITGLDLAGDNNPDLIFASSSPPLVLPQENFPGPYGISDYNPYPNNPTPDSNSIGINSNTYDFTNSPAPLSINWLGLASDINSQPPTSGITGYNYDQAIPPWRYDIQQSQTNPTNIPNIILSPSGQFNEAVVKDKKKSILKQLLPWIGIIGGIRALSSLINEFVDDAPEEPEERKFYFTHNLPDIKAKFILSPNHKGKDECDDFSGEIYNLSDTVNRPILPSEGLGYTNLVHPNCHCLWRIEKGDKSLDSLTKKEKSKFNDINSHIKKAAKDHTLHTVKPDGSLSNRTRGTNPMKEAIGNVYSEFKWIDNDYIRNAKEMAQNNNGKLYLIRAATQTITDHTQEGEKYRRKLAGTELNGMARTAIGKKMDINHNSQYTTQAKILDAEYDSHRKEIQMIVLEQDNTVNDAINNGSITAVSINGGNPRNQILEKCDDNCTSGDCEICNVPQGVILGEDDKIALTWVVTDSRGIMWNGMHIPQAEPGIKNTVIQPL